MPAKDRGNHLMSKGIVDNPSAADRPSGAGKFSVGGESVTAFIGPAPRGPVDFAVAISSADEFDKRFGVPDYHCRMAAAVRQFFVNGGRNAVVVRVCSSRQYNRISLPAGDGCLQLQARNPGPLEFLRASVDYDGIAPDRARSFNLVVQRLRCADSAWIDEQEYYRGITVDPDSRDSVARILVQSALVRVRGALPAQRPEATIKPGSLREAGYIGAVALSVSNTAPDDYDLIGCSEAGTGLNALRGIADLGRICLISGAADGAIGPVAMLAADRFCRDRQALLLADPPARWRTVDDVIADQRRSDFHSPNAVTWYPGVRLRDAGAGAQPTSACGAVAAALAEDERTRGVPRLRDDELPVLLRGALTPFCAVSPDDERRLARAGVNTLARRSALHLQLRGNVTQSRHASIVGADDLDVRAEVLYIMRRVRQATRWVAGYDSGPRVWREARQQVAGFLERLREQGHLRGNSARDAWFVRCDSSVNPGNEGHRGRTTLIIGVALREPGMFRVMRFQHSPDACMVSECGGAELLSEAV